MEPSPFHKSFTLTSTEIQPQSGDLAVETKVVHHPSNFDLLFPIKPVSDQHLQAFLPQSQRHLVRFKLCASLKACNVKLSFSSRPQTTRISSKYAVSPSNCAGRLTAPLLLTATLAAGLLTFGGMKVNNAFALYPNLLFLWLSPVAASSYFLCWYTSDSSF